MPDLDYHAMLQIALEEARQGRAEGGIPIGAALFHRQGQLLGRGHNRRVRTIRRHMRKRMPSARQDGNAVTAIRSWSRPWRHAGIVAAWCASFVSVPSWWRIGQFCRWAGVLRDNGVTIYDLHDTACITLLAEYIAAYPDIWHEDIGEE